jgi:hypothetical protein
MGPAGARCLCHLEPPLLTLKGHAHEQTQWPVDWRMDWHAHMVWACPNLFFLKCPFVTARHVQSGTHWHINGGEEGMNNRVEELLKGGQR